MTAPEIVLEFATLLSDGPAAARDRDELELSLNSPSMYWLAASRCGWRLKQPLNPSRY